MRRLTTWDQCKRMSKEWPQFQTLQRTRREVVWIGRIRPLCQTYQITLAYYREPDRRLAEMSQSWVVVTDPLLRRQRENSAEPIPHHYPNVHCPWLPFLCLYDSDAREWHSGLFIASTVVPWTIDWLACYEGWLATGEWTGGGRHPATG